MAKPRCLHCGDPFHGGHECPELRVATEFVELEAKHETLCTAVVALREHEKNTDLYAFNQIARVDKWACLRTSVDKLVGLTDDA